MLLLQSAAVDLEKARKGAHLPRVAAQLCSSQKACVPSKFPNSYIRSEVSGGCLAGLPGRREPKARGVSDLLYLPLNNIDVEEFFFEITNLKYTCNIFVVCLEK